MINMRRLISFVLVLTLVFGLVPVSALHVHATESEPVRQNVSATDFAGKRVSILGDSISTYTGVSNNSSYNSTIGKNKLYYSYGGKLGVYRADTWWQQIIDVLGMELCVNNSWTSSCVYTERNGTLGAYVDRCVQLHNDHKGENPDVVLVFMGTNDFSYYKSSWGNIDEVDFDSLYTDNGNGTYTYKEAAGVYEAYAQMLHKMQVAYPGVEIYCMGLAPRPEGSSYGQPTTYNAGLKKVVEHFGCTYVDIESKFTTDEDELAIYMGDDRRIHPNPYGMDVLSKAVIDAMLGKENSAFALNYAVENATCDTNKTMVVAGEAFEATVTKNEGYRKLEMTVTMGGENVTKQYYDAATGKISIPHVTGDVQITALGYGNPADFVNLRWEMNADGNALVNVVPEGFATNALTLQTGSVESGKIVSARFALEKPIVLASRDEWIIEWKSSGDWKGMILSSSASVTNGTGYLYRNSSTDLLAFGIRTDGSYNNYGIDTTGVMSNLDGTHVYRLENRVYADGSNMVYLIIDGTEIGPMNNYWVGSTDKKTTSDYLNDRDWTFNYIGANGSQVLNNMKLEYLQILCNGDLDHVHSYTMTGETEGTCSSEGYFTYTCRCGDSYTVSNGKLGTEHDLTPWEIVDGMLQRHCRLCDYAETDFLTAYRWEISEDGKSLVSVTTDGTTNAVYTENAFTLTSGSINNGALKNVYGKLAESFTLSPSDEWVIEWNSSVGWSGMLLASTASGAQGTKHYVYRNNTTSLMAIGTRPSSYQNYGQVTKDVVSGMSGLHTFRLENRVAADGSNMVYLVIDNKEIGPMNNYWIGSKDQGKTSDYLNGLELTFGFLGTAAHEVSMTLDYLEVWVNGTTHRHAYTGVTVEGTCISPGSTTYTCACGDSYVTSSGEYGDHAYDEWEVVDGELRRYCEHCGGYETENISGFRWEYDQETDSLISVITNGNTQNNLSVVEGGIVDGVLTNSRFQFDTEISLVHDQPWIIEWEGTGDWNGMLLSSHTATTNGMLYVFRKSDVGLAIGTYNGEDGYYYHYGVAASAIPDVIGTHVFRLENRVAADGSNMIYLVVDDVEIGAMTTSFRNTTNKKTESDWLNGKDFVFKYIGKNSHEVNGLALNYLQVWVEGANEHKHAYTVTPASAGDCQTEGTSIYTCACGHTFEGPSGAFGDHDYDAWIENGKYREHTCRLCGKTESVLKGVHYDETVSNNYYTVISQKDYVLCDGVVESELIINNSDGTRRQVLHVVEVDAMNPNALILPGYYGIDKDLTNPSNWLATTVEDTMEYYRDELGYNVVAGMNIALTYASDAPCSFLVYNGQVLAEPGSIYNDNCDTYLAVIDNGDGTVSCELRYTSEPLTGNELHALAANFGFTVKDGKVTAKSIAHSGGSDRSMIGIKADGTLVIVQNEGRNSPYSVGLSNSEMGEAMLAMGCIWAVNGDGGGSSQILTKREGESDYTLRNNPSDGAVRATIMSILVASKAAPSGEFDHASMLVENNYITPKGTVKITVKGVDESGMPAVLPAGITYTATGGTYADGVFTSDGTLGEQTITAFYNGEEVGSVSVNVVIPTSISFDNAAMAVPYGKTVEIPISAYYGAFEVALSGADVEFELSNEIGTISGLFFTAPTEENAAEENTAEMTVTLVYNPELTATIVVYVGKGSEVLFDFEDADLHGWYRLTETNYNAIRVGGDTYLVDASNGHVFNGDYAMAVELDYSNSLEGHFLRGILAPSKRVILENAMSIGMWVYFPDEADPLMVDVQVPVYNEIGIHVDYITLDVGVADCLDGGVATAGFLNALDESGWHYITVDVSSAQYVGLPMLKFYVSQKDGVNDYIYGEQTNANGKYILYVDDITVDYSRAVDDREAPIFGDMTYLVSNMDEAEVLDGNTVEFNTVTFETTVADNMFNEFYSGIDADSVEVFIDGVDRTESMTVSGLSDLTLTLTDVELSDGMHTIKFVAYDKMGNRSAIARDIIINSAEDATVKVVAHDPDADRILTGSLYYIDVVANDPANISSVTVVMDLNNISFWQLDHMEVAEGFQATYTLVEDENIATVTIVSVGETDLSGDNQVLVSIPVRTWELPIVEPVTGHEGRVYMYHDYKSYNSTLPMDLHVETDSIVVVYKTGVQDSFTSPKILVMTELSGQAITSSGSAIMNYIGNEPWYAEWNGGHDHRPETKQYYGEGTTNHVDAVAVPDKPATCTEDGYTGRTYCEVCQSVVDWGTVVPGGHKYETVDGVHKCTGCGDLYNGVIDGLIYENGVLKNGWDGKSYYKNGAMVTGIQCVPSPEGDGKEYYYDFGEDGICDTMNKYTGIFADGDVYRYAYLGELATGWQNIDGAWYYFNPSTKANVSGKFKIGKVTFEFEDDGKLVSGVWVRTLKGNKYCYGPGYYDERWYQIDGEWYFFREGYAVLGVQYVDDQGFHNREYRWYDFGEDGAARELKSDFFYSAAGKLIYAEDGYPLGGLHKVGDDYYLTLMNGEVICNQVYNAWETNCDLPKGDYEFGPDGKMLQGIVEKADGLYYYVNGKAGRQYGLLKIDGDYYFVLMNGKLITSQCYNAWETNCDLPKGDYYFGPDGKMVMRGIVLIDGTYYYCVDGKAGKEYGLVKVDGDYYFALMNGKLIVNQVYEAWETNCDLPLGKYEFGADGKMLQGIVEKNGVEYFYYNGNTGKASGLMKSGSDYYYVLSDGTVARNQTVAVEVTYCDLPAATYEFGADGKMLQGIVKKSDGLYYFVNGQTGNVFGLVEVDGEHYFALMNGQLITNQKYHAWKTMCNMPMRTYEFGADGKMLQGFVQKADGLYYYVDGQMMTGLVEVDGAYYGIDDYGHVVMGQTAAITSSNCDLPAGVYEFGADGKMLMGIVTRDDGYYYYHNGQLGVVTGLIKLDGYFYYVQENGKLITSQKFYVEKTNGLLLEDTYTFDQYGRITG